jgi:hypothetical protein
MYPLNWEEFKTSLMSIGINAVQLSHLELDVRYIVWFEWRGMRVCVEDLRKGSEECSEFESTFKSMSNTKEAERVRITTNKLGRKLHDRYVNFFTATGPESMDNTDWKDVSFGDFTYIMKDASGNTTTVPSLAKETWLDFEPTYDFEVSGGWVCIPDTLPGNDDDKWEIHVVGAPDIPEGMGGSVKFICNPRLKWIRGQRLNIDASLNPAELTYNAVYHSNKIRFVIKHPVGAQCEMQINIKIFK